MNHQTAFILLGFTAAMPYLIFAVILVKIILFVRYKTSQWTLANLIYFRAQHIVSPKTREKTTIKIIENSLSFYVVFLILLNTVLSFVLHA